MLVPAISKKAELLEKFSNELYSDKYFLFSGYPHDHDLPEIKAEYGTYQYAIVNSSGKVVGYLAYYIDAYVDCVQRFQLFSFGGGDIIVGVDAYTEIKRLVSQHHRVEWRMVGGNKAKGIYDRICQRYGGKVFRFKDQIKDPYGNYRDGYTYEIVTESEAEHNG